MNTNEFIGEAKHEKEALIDLIIKLQKNNRYDHYWKELLQLSKDPDFFEPCVLQYWIGKKYKPSAILEIGTRTGGSLIALLASYSSYEQIQVVSFDLWKETSNTILLGRVPLIRSVFKLYPISRMLSFYILKRNLRIFNIPASRINFVSGDSKKTVPAFFRKNPDQKFDYILVDGAHDAETAYIDLENIATHVASNGFVLFDDISPESYNLISVWNKFKTKHSTEFTFFESFHRKGIAWAIRK